MIRIVIAIILSIISSQGFAASVSETIPESMRQIYFKLAYVNHEKMNYISDSRLDNAGTSINVGLNDNSRYNSLAVGSGLIFPLVDRYGLRLLGVGYLEYIPGDTAVASNTLSNVQASVKSQRVNLGGGVIAQYFHTDKLFSQGQFSAGMTRLHLHGEVFRPDAYQSADHPGVDSTEPFVAAELSVGYQLNHDVRILLFGSYAISHVPRPMVIGEQPQTGSVYLNMDVPHRWMQCGVTYVRDIKL